MTTVAFIGSGMIGGTLARLSVAAGHQVVLSNSRGPETLKDLVDELGPLARAATSAEAAGSGGIVVVALPVKAYKDLPAAELSGKLIVDAGNYYPQRDGQIAELDSHALTSTQYLARFAPGATVVKGFNNIFFRHLQSLARPSGAADRTFLPIAGDDAAAKAAVTAYLDSIGYGAVDDGSLADSWRQEPGTPVYGAPYGAVADTAGLPAGADLIRSALSWATRR